MTEAKRQRLENAQFQDFFDDIFKCNICLDQFQDPRMCFHCSKLFCKKCIENWLGMANARGKCPYCKRHLKRRLVVIRWQDDLENIHFMRQVEQYEGVICNWHEKDLKMFCTSCQQLICIDCVDLPMHEFHSFKPIKSVISEFMMPFKTTEAKITSIIEEITEITRTIDQQKVEIETSKTQALRKLNSFKEKEIAEFLAKTEVKYQPFISAISEQKDLILKNLIRKEVESTKILNSYKEMQQKMADTLKLTNYELFEQHKGQILLREVDKILSAKIDKDVFFTKTTIYDS